MTRNVDIEPVKWRKGYKLIELHHNGDRTSLCVSSWPSRIVYYPRMTEAYPQPGTGPLTVFTRKADVRAFFKANGWETVATVCRWETGATVCRCVFVPSPDQGVGLWGTDAATKSHPFTALPPGTALADIIVCLE